MEKKQWGITKLYNEYFAEPTSQIFKLHAKLDGLLPGFALRLHLWGSFALRRSFALRLVMQAYGFSKSDDILEKLLMLNLELAEKEKRGEAIVGAWAPEG